MRLDWAEVRARAAKFSEDWKFATRESADKHSFWNEFFACFGIDRKQVATYERRVENLPREKQGFIDLFMPGKLIVEHKSAGLDLRRAENQAFDYYDALPQGEKPRYVLTCDFQIWNLLDLEENRRILFRLPELKKHITAFAFIPGVEVRRFRNQKPANPKATQLLTAIHRQLEEDGYTGHELQLLLVRLLFCLFADDTGIWDKDILFADLQERTQPDGSDLGAFLTQLFETLNTPKEKRQAGLPDHFKRYEYVNGKLFEEPIRTAAFNNALRSLLIDASAFDWGSVSPAIFGALFEGVIDKITQRQQGAHYTPEEAIIRLIGPLFLEGLYEDFEKLRGRADGGRQRALVDFQDHLASLTFFDPACGAGNFLVVTYRELRELERLVIEELYPPQSGARQGVLDVKLLTKVNVDQFYGIEIDEFPSQIAQVALWLTDHIANVNLGEMFGRVFPDMPIVAAPHIQRADALEVDWNDVIPSQQCDYIFGNPPFGGSKYQTDKQRAQVQRVANLGGSGGTLDYVAAWFIRAGEYAAESDAKIAFVATNSICQGEQVAQLWPILFHKLRLEIAFAHRTFVWPGRAAVHCIIVGLVRSGNEPSVKRLFSYADGKGQPIETHHEALTAYLFAAEGDRYLVVESRNNPINGAPRLQIGSKPVDGGYLIFTPDERAKLLQEDPSAERFLKPYIGAEEFLNAGLRYILALQDTPPAELRQHAAILRRLQLVREWREGKIARKDSKTGEDRAAASTYPLAATPSAFHVTAMPTSHYLVVPENGSETREYVPAGWLGPEVIPSSLIRVSLDAELWHFAVLISKMHMAWLDNIGGKLKSDPRYSITLVYNTFPWPEPSPAQRVSVEQLAQGVLDARALPKNTTSTLSDLYHPNRMPIELRKAHRALDAAVDKLYSSKGFRDDRARVEYLFKLYEALVLPTAAAAAANRRTKRRVARESSRAA